MIKTGPCLSNGGGVAQHADSSLHFSKIATRYNSWWLVVDADLESGWAPIDELDGSLGLDGCNSGADILGDNITTVQHAAGHVFSVTWVTFDHLVGWLEASVGDLGNGELFMVCLLGGDDWGVGGQWEWIRGYGTKLVWNSVKSTLRAPSKRREAVMDETICSSWCRLVFRCPSYDGRYRRWLRCRP